MLIKTLDDVQTAFRDIPRLRKPAPEAPRLVSKLAKRRA
jgi:hypothetical protein